MKSIPKTIKLLSIIFLLIFCAYNGVQQYIILFFSSFGASQLGFYSLILIYISFAICNPFTVILISKIGVKKSIQIAIICYSLFILSLITRSMYVVYASSTLLGAAAALLWTSQGSYLVRVTKKDSLGISSGYFTTFLFLGSTIGILFSGFIIQQTSYTVLFLLASIIPIFGLILSSKLKEFTNIQSTNHLQDIKKAITSPTALRLSTIWFSVSFTLGLAIGFIPIEIKDKLGVRFVGLTSIFYLLPIFLSFYWGKLSDEKGRKIVIIASFVVNGIGLLLLFLFHSSLSLIIGMFLLALSSSMLIPTISSLVGDISTKHTLEYLVGLFLMVQSLGTISALIISAFVHSE
ncbi:MAG: MFS transporter, partial [Patescibacteria group bacterium]